MHRARRRSAQHHDFETRADRSLCARSYCRVVTAAWLDRVCGVHAGCTLGLFQRGALRERSSVRLQVEACPHLAAHRGEEWLGHAGLLPVLRPVGLGLGHSQQPGSTRPRWGLCGHVSLQHPCLPD